MESLLRNLVVLVFDEVMDKLESSGLKSYHLFFRRVFYVELPN